MKYTDEECETTADNLERILEAGASFHAEIEKAIEMLRERLDPQPVSNSYRSVQSDEATKSEALCLILNRWVEPCEECGEAYQFTMDDVDAILASLDDEATK